MTAFPAVCAFAPDVSKLQPVKPSSKIKNIVFDVGQVLFAYNPELVIDRLIPESLHKAYYLEHLFLSPMWHQMDRGDVSHEQAKHRLFGNDPVKRLELDRLLDNFALHLDVIEGTRDLFLQLGKRFPLYLLSNFQAEAFDVLLQANPFLNQATGMVVSGQINMMKPEPEIYDYLLSTHNLNPSETVFIDDLAENIAAARVAGMHGIVFESPAQLKSALLPFTEIWEDIK